MRQENGYLTVFLCLFLAVILSLYLTLIEGVRENGARLEAVCAAEAAMQSIMAEYNRELARQYNIYAIDSSYGTDSCGRNYTEAHLMKYLKKNVGYEGIVPINWFYRDFFALQPYDAELSRIAILTDDAGAVFRKQAIEAIRSDTGLEYLSRIQEWMKVIELNGFDTSDVEAEREQIEKELQEYQTSLKIISEIRQTQEAETPDTAGEFLEDSEKGLLRLVLGEDDTLSAKKIEKDTIYSSRAHKKAVSTGNMNVSANDSLIDQYLFREYMLQYLGNYTNQKEECALSYQIEYAIAGKDSDAANLKSVVNRIILLRGGANTYFLKTNKEKQAEIKTAAALLALLILEPRAQTAFEAAIINIWASAESVYDTKILLSGGKVPLLKDERSWHYSFSRLFLGGKEEETQESGMKYEDYLRILCIPVRLNKLTERTMDMVEADVRMTKGNTAFRLDACYSGFEAQIRMKDSRNKEYEIIREKNY